MGRSSVQLLSSGLGVPWGPSGMVRAPERESAELVPHVPSAGDTHTFSAHRPLCVSRFHRPTGDPAGVTSASPWRFVRVTPPGLGRDSPAASRPAQLLSPAPPDTTVLRGDRPHPDLGEPGPVLPRGPGVCPHRTVSGFGKCLECSRPFLHRPNGRPPGNVFYFKFLLTQNIYTHR